MVHYSLQLSPAHFMPKSFELIESSPVETGGRGPAIRLFRRYIPLYNSNSGQWYIPPRIVHFVICISFWNLFIFAFRFINFCWVSLIFYSFIIYRYVYVPLYIYFYCLFVHLLLFFKLFFRFIICLFIIFYWKVWNNWEKRS